jgi:CspA family cold shock protein
LGRYTTPIKGLPTHVSLIGGDLPNDRILARLQHLPPAERPGNRLDHGVVNMPGDGGGGDFGAVGRGVIAPGVVAVPAPMTLSKSVDRTYSFPGCAAITSSSSGAPIDWPQHLECPGHSPEICYMAKGNVKWFNPTKGYGFIQPQGGGKDVFVHISAVEKAGLSTLNEGQAVEFEEVSNRGKTSAENLKVQR